MSELEEMKAMFAEMKAEIASLKAENTSLKTKPVDKSDKRSPINNIRSIRHNDKTNVLTIEVETANLRKVTTGTGKSYILCRTNMHQSDRKAEPVGITFDKEGNGVVHLERVPGAVMTLMCDLLTGVEVNTFVK